MIAPVERSHRRARAESAAPFTEATAWEKLKKAENAWNTRDPEQVAQG